MSSNKISTIQTGAHQFNTNGITKYSLMMGGLNVTRDALAMYDPQIGGYYRIFMVRKPVWVNEYFKTTGGETSKMDAFKHILEYGNLGVSGIQGIDVEMEEIRGGYANRAFEIPKMSNDGTTELTIKVMEFSGSPIREILHTWVNGSIDTQTAMAHYNGLIAAGVLEHSQANQTAEFIYVVTDQTGHKVNYACMFANCFPKSVPADHFNGEAGEHNYAQLDVTFTCTKYEGIDVNNKALELLSKHQIMVNSLEFYSGLDISKEPTSYYNASNGQMVEESTTSTGSIKNAADAAKRTLYRADTKNIVTAATPKRDYYGNSTDATNGIYTTPSFTRTANEFGNK